MDLKGENKTNNETSWNCGKIGHRAKDCLVPNKKKDKINILELGNNVKENIFWILNENEISSSCDESLSDDNQLNVAYSSDSSDLTDHSNCSGAICTYDSHSKNVITNSKEKEALFDMIDNLKDPTLRWKCLIALKDIILDQQVDNK